MVGILAQFSFLQKIYRRWSPLPRKSKKRLTYCPARVINLLDLFTQGLYPAAKIQEKIDKCPARVINFL